MRTALAAAALVLIPAVANAAPPEKFYYLGEVKLNNPAGKPIGSQAILVEKTVDRDNSVILERAIVVEADGKVVEYPVRMPVKPDGTFTLTNDEKSVEGNGQLFGPAWKWTYFKATFKAKNGITIEDENFMADDSAATARKKVIGPNGQVMLYMDETLKAITPKTFEILRTALTKK
ncbi:MAG TPA: hypothetical protein VH120_01350 [Gemmataceae bacterium]|jgi:hypothetical protein|nr:hypothetical protein [Gemmataceae bacterium]